MIYFVAFSFVVVPWLGLWLPGAFLPVSWGSALGHVSVRQICMRQEKGDYRGNGVLLIVDMCFVYRLALYSGWIQFDGFNALPICKKNNIYIQIIHAGPLALSLSLFSLVCNAVCFLTWSNMNRGHLGCFKDNRLSRHVCLCVHT